MLGRQRGEPREDDRAGAAYWSNDPEAAATGKFYSVNRIRTSYVEFTTVVCQKPLLDAVFGLIAFNATFCHPAGWQWQRKVRRGDWRRGLQNSTVRAEDSPSNHRADSFVATARAPARMDSRCYGE